MMVVTSGSGMGGDFRGRPSQVPTGPKPEKEQTPGQIAENTDRVGKRVPLLTMVEETGHRPPEAEAIGPSFPLQDDGARVLTEGRGVIHPGRGNGPAELRPERHFARQEPETQSRGAQQELVGPFAKEKLARSSQGDRG